MTSATDASRFGRGAFAPIAVATRNGFDESEHRGAAVVLGPDGVVTSSVGDTELGVFARSALKPFQASAMVRAGLDLPHRLLAVVAASHSGEKRHLDAVLEIIDRYGLSVDDLDNTASLPHGTVARSTAIAAGRAPSSLQQNCSGKHAGMLATCRINDWPIDSYLDPAHPVQEAVSAEIERLVAAPSGSIVHIGIDGCGAPTHVMPLGDVARALRTMMLERSEVCAAMMAHPGIVAGNGRDVTLWMEAVPGLVAKEGADGVMVVAGIDGRAGALKIADGSDRARRAVTIELMRRMGVDVDRDHADVLARVEVAVLGHGAVVGSVRPLNWD